MGGGRASSHTCAQYAHVHARPHTQAHAQAHAHAEARLVPVFHLQGLSLAIFGSCVLGPKKDNLWDDMTKKVHTLGSCLASLYRFCDHFYSPSRSADIIWIRVSIPNFS